MVDVAMLAEIVLVRYQQKHTQLKPTANGRIVIMPTCLTKMVNKVIILPAKH